MRGQNLGRKKQRKREYLKNEQTKEMMKRLENHFETIVEVPRIKFGNQQNLETLIDEEASLFAKFLRNENKKWNPRIPIS